LSVFCWRCTNAVNFSLYLLDKSIWLQPIRKGIFNIKLGYYTCKRKVGKLDIIYYGRNATFTNISVISWWSALFNGGRNRMYSM
jgi:hypothetical protein